MSRRVLAVLMASLFPLLAACGNDSGSSGSAAGEVTVTGDFGKAPVVKFSKDFAATKVTTKVLIKGEGDPIAKTDQVEANIWIGTPMTAEGQAFSTFGQQTMTLDPTQDLPKIFGDVLAGHNYGTRLLVTSSAKDGFGEGGNPQLGVGNADSVAMVVDLVEKYVKSAAEIKAEKDAAKAAAEAAKPAKVVEVGAKKMPAIVEKDGKVTNVIFKGLTKPQENDALLRHVVKEGDGPVVTRDMTVKVNYFGRVWGEKGPFDESFTREPAEFALTGVIKGWTDGLAGMKVGSRVQLTVPPRYGYGDKEQGAIPANSTLFFVVDILSATPASAAQ